MTLMNQIREAISRDHDAIEKTEFSIALITSQIHREDYLLNLAQMYHIHAALETACHSEASLTEFFPPPMIRTEALRRDLNFFGADVKDFRILEATTVIAEQIATWKRQQPFMLIGCIYVLEGSRMGSMVLTKPIAAALGVASGINNGLDYHVEGARETPARLKQWKELVSNAGFSESVASEIETCAVEFMHLLCNLYRALPVSRSTNKHVA